MLKNLSIKKKLISILIIPLAVIVLLVFNLLSESYNKNKNLEKLENVIMLSTKIAKLAHELQNERILSIGFIGSNGEKFANELLLQRKHTTKAQKEFKLFTNTFNMKTYDNKFGKLLNKAKSQLKKLKTKRVEISDISIGEIETIKYYTSINKPFFDLIGNIAKTSSQPELTLQLTAYINFLLSKKDLFNKPDMKFS